jgi:hypothetical protein
MRRVNWLAALTLFALVGGVGTSEGALTLVKDGQPASAIVIADEACEAARLGATELQYHLKKMSGAVVPIVPAAQAPDDPATARILVGRSPLTDAINMDPSALADEGYMIRTSGNALVILGDDGKDPAAALAGKMDDYHGTLMGVYGFLEDQLGCAWLWPGATGEHTPKMATIEVGDLDIVNSPALLRRHMRLVLKKMVPGLSTKLLGEDALSQLVEDETTWYRRMRMGRSRSTPPVQGHAFTTWWEKYSDTKPEIFAMLPDGTRGFLGKDPTRVKMCVANPEFWEMQLDQFKERHAQDPNYHELSCNENDGNNGFCTCPLCKAWDVTAENIAPEILSKLYEDFYMKLLSGPDGIPACLSARYAKWYNELARRVREIDPEGYVSAYAYTRWRQMPIGVTLEPNMIIGYCALYNYPRTPTDVANERRDYLGWAQSGVKVYLRPNSPHYAGNGLPYNVARQIADDWIFCVNNGTFMADVDSMNGYWAAWGPTYYVIPRIMWEGGSANTNELLEEWYSAFGPAERQIRTYYEFWERTIFWSTCAADPDPVKTAFEPFAPYYRSTTGSRPVVKDVDEIYKPEVMAGAQVLLDKAILAAADADDEVKAKVENVAMCQRHTELTMNAYRLSKAQPRDDAAVKAALMELAAYRTEIAPRNVVNVYRITDCEAGRGGYWTGWKLPWDLVVDSGPQTDQPGD